MYESNGDQERISHHLQVLQKFPEDVVLLLGAQLTLALHYLHDAGLGFWTLSPNKLWFGSDGALMIKEPLLYLGPGSIPQEMMLPSYRSPEHFQAGGEQVVADWWRLGLVMYELVTGVNPFAKTPEAVIPKFKATELKFPSEVSKSTQELIKALMNPNPNSRLGHANDAAEVKASPLWGPTIGQSWDAILSHPMTPAPWLKSNILDPAQAKVKSDNRPQIDKSESVVELMIKETRGVVLEEADTGADPMQKKSTKKEKKLPPKLLCKVDFEGQFNCTQCIASGSSFKVGMERKISLQVSRASPANIRDGRAGDRSQQRLRVDCGGHPSATTRYQAWARNPSVAFDPYSGGDGERRGVPVCHFVQVR